MREDQRTGILPIPENMANWRAHRRQYANIVWLLSSGAAMNMMSLKCQASGNKAGANNCFCCVEGRKRSELSDYAHDMCYYCPLDWGVSRKHSQPCLHSKSLYQSLCYALTSCDREQATYFARKIRDAKWKPRPKRRKK